MSLQNYKEQPRKHIDTQSLSWSLGYHKEQSASCLKQIGERLLHFIYSTWPVNNDYQRLDHISKHRSFQVIRTQASQKNIVLRFHGFILSSTQSTSYLLTHRPSITGHSFQSHKDLSTSCLTPKGQYFLLHPSRLDCLTTDIRDLTTNSWNTRSIQVLETTTPSSTRTNPLSTKEKGKQKQKQKKKRNKNLISAKKHPQCAI